MIGYICPRCRKKVPSGRQCPCRMKQYEKDSKVYAFYHSKEWAKLVQAIRARDGGIDRYAWHVHQIYAPGRIVHHIIPVEENWELRFDPNNLILVSDTSHGKIHAALKGQEQERNRVINACRASIGGRG